MSGAAPELSIVLATGHGWSDAERTVRALLASESPGAMEVILCDGSGSEGPPSEWDDPRLTVIEAPGESVFGLRALGVAASRGAVVAITEDHCVPAPDWPAELLAAHARHPEAPAIAGAVDNGGTETVWDWANFLVTFAEHMPPMDSVPAKRSPAVANGSFKRALVELPADPEPGWLELKLLPDLVAAGRVARDDGPRVIHDQSHGGLGGTLAAHFHNGRACAGLRVDAPGAGAVREEWRRLLGLPRRLTRELHEALAARPPLRGKAATGARLTPLFAVAHTVGECAGLLTGPGRSAEQLE